MSKTLIDRPEISITVHRPLAAATPHLSLVLVTKHDDHAPLGDRFNRFDGTMDRVEVIGGRRTVIYWSVVLTYFVSGDPDTPRTVAYAASTRREAVLGAAACLPRSAISHGRAKSERDARDLAAAARRGLQLDAEDARAAGKPATAVDAVAEGLRMWHGLG